MIGKPKEDIIKNKDVERSILVIIFIKNFDINNI